MKYKYDGKIYDIPDEFLNQGMKNGLSKMEAVQLWLEDNGILEQTQEQKELDKKASGVKIKAAAGMRPASKRTNTREPDYKKRELVQILFEGLNAAGKEKGIVGIQVTKEEREIIFRVGADDYTVTLTKHRKSK